MRDEYNELEGTPKPATLGQRFFDKWKEVPIGYDILAMSLITVSIAAILLITLFPPAGAVALFAAPAEVLGIAFGTVGQLLTIAAAVVGALAAVGHLIHIALKDDEYVAPPKSYSENRRTVSSTFIEQNNVVSKGQEHQQNKEYRHAALPAGAPPLVSQRRPDDGYTYTPPTATTTPKVPAEPQTSPGSNQNVNTRRFKDVENVKDLEFKVELSKGYTKLAAQSQAQGKDNKGNKEGDTQTLQTTPKAPPPRLSAIREMTEEQLRAHDQTMGRGAPSASDPLLVSDPPSKVEGEKAATP